MTSLEKTGVKYSLAIGFPVALFYTIALPSLLVAIFSLSFFSTNQGLGIFFNPLIFAIVMPIAYFFIFFRSGIRIASTNENSILKRSYRFSLSTNFKIFLIHIAIYIGSLLVNGISVTVHATILSTLLFPIIIFIAFFILSTIFTTFTTNLIISKLVSNHRNKLERLKLTTTT